MIKGTHIFTVHEDGNITTLHTDEIPLAELGHLSVKRASSIEFNEDTQQWGVLLGNDVDFSFTSPSRAECIAWEIVQLNGKV